MLRKATPQDWGYLFGTAPPVIWYGQVSEDNGKLHGMGGVFFSEDARWWVFIHRAPGVKMTKTAHASARKLIDDIRAVGMRVYALADTRFDGAEMWLERLGFRVTDEKIGDVNVWTL